jgi:hypothetical protein
MENTKKALANWKEYLDSEEAQFNIGSKEREMMKNIVKDIAKAVAIDKQWAQEEQEFNSHLGRY